MTLSSSPTTCYSSVEKMVFSNLSMAERVGPAPLSSHPFRAGGTPENQWFSSSVFRAIYFLNAQTGYAAGWNMVSNSEIIIKTIDGGTTWVVSHIGQLKG